MIRSPALILGTLLASTLSASAQAETAMKTDPARLSAIVRTLSSDEFEGRGPGSAGETKTIAYLSKAFGDLGLKPAGDGNSFVQNVPLLKTQIVAPGQFSVTVAGQTTPLVFGRDIMGITLRPVDHVTIAAAPLVFVGYGVTAPERNWDDFKDQDLKGKVAIILINDPDFEAGPGEPVAGRFGGQAEAYYGRWTYKYDEAIRRGAVAALIVHETPGAGYGWSTVVAPAGEGFDIVRNTPDQARLALQAWISREAAQALFHQAGLDFEALKQQARREDFRPVVLQGAHFSADYALSHTQVISHNVIGKLVGAKHPDESVMLSAHWDAYGVGPADERGRTIRAGAADDAIGVAGVLELARAFIKAPRPDRSVYFAAWTGEERGLLGSEFYGVHPTTDLDLMAANLTMDVLQTAGPSRDVVLVGYGQSQLDDLLKSAASDQGRTVTPDAHPERGLFFRADHFSLARRGVPVLLMMGLGGGPDLVTGGRAAGDKWVSDYTANCYHKACDAWSPDWDLRGAAADVDLLQVMARQVAGTRTWPQWSPGSEFKALRDASADRRSH